MLREPCTLLLEPYRLPFRQPLRTAHGPWTEREGLYVRLESADGRVGRGEVAPIPWFGTETLAEAEEMLRKFGGRAEGDVLARVPERFGCVRFALSCAMDEVERESAEVERGLPPSPFGLWRAGRTREGSGEKQERAAETRPRPEVYPPLAAPEATRAAVHPTAAHPTRLPVAALLPAGRAAREALARQLEAGFLAFKWKVGVERPEDELAILDDLLAALPSYARLRLDANGAWDRRVAARWLERCAERPVEFVEQPLAPGDVDGLQGLAADYPVKLALDESVVRLAEAREWQARGWPGLFVIKPALCGPLDEIAQWARETKADVVLSSAIETAVARRPILDWAVRTGVTKRALGFGVGEIFESVGLRSAQTEGFLSPWYPPT